MTRATVQKLRQSVRAKRYACRVVTVGTGRHVEAGLHGKHADFLAKHLETMGFRRTPMSGTGATALDMICMDGPDL